ncbi:L-rhamnose mutarotase [Verrucomicrobiota bacterium]
MKVKRFGSIIGLNPEKEAYYRELHANVWPSIKKRLKQSNLSNFSIYITELEGKKYLVKYFEYTGDSFEDDIRRIADDPETQKWFKETAPCQIPLPSRKEGSYWSDMEQIFLME